MSIVDVKKAYLDRVAAGALGRVQKRLADYVMALLFGKPTDRGLYPSLPMTVPR